jgi:hypothetical protein
VPFHEANTDAAMEDDVFEEELGDEEDGLRNVGTAHEAWFLDRASDSFSHVTSAASAFLQLVSDQPTLSFAPPGLHDDIRRIYERLPPWLNPRAPIADTLTCWVSEMNKLQSTKCVAVKVSWNHTAERAKLEVC